MDEQGHQAAHGAESSGRSASAETRAGEGGEERATYRHPDTHRDQVSRLGAFNQSTMDEADPGVDAGGDPEDVLNLDDSLLVESEEPDFADDTGTTDVMLAVEEGYTYFPPVDPVITPDARSSEGLSILGGFGSDSLESPLEVDQLPAAVRPGDDELALAVHRALRADSYTTDLLIEVEVEDGVAYLRGVVHSLEDVEQAEEVAGRVPGIEDVEEELEIV